jgi:hypothetical protein
VRQWLSFLGLPADRCPCVEKLRTVLPLTVGIRDGVVQSVSVLGSVFNSARVELPWAGGQVSEWVDGVKITELPPAEIQEMTAVGAKCFLFQLLELGSFHGDPHPGEGGSPPHTHTSSSVENGSAQPGLSR